MLDVAGTLTAEQRHRPFSIVQDSIWKSLVHLYAAEYVWPEALMDNDKPTLPGDLPGKIPGIQLGEGGASSFDGLRTKWNEL